MQRWCTAAKKQDDGFKAIKLDNPVNAPPRTRVGLFATYPKSQLAHCNFGHGLAVIDTQAETMRKLPLPAHPLKFSFDNSSKTAMVLTHDGVLHRLSLATGGMVPSESIVAAVEPPKGPDGKPRPTFAIGNDLIYVAAPDENRLIEIALTDMKVRRTLEINHKPFAIIYLCGKG